MNIFSRLNDNDLLKYLNPEEDMLFSQIAKEISLNKNDQAEFDLSQSIYVVKKGFLQIQAVNPHNQKIIIDECKENEILWEPPFFTILVRQIYPEIIENAVLLQYSREKADLIFKDYPLIHLKIQAALNDSLCEKHIRITQKLVRM